MGKQCVVLQKSTNVRRTHAHFNGTQSLGRVIYSKVLTSNYWLPCKCILPIINRCVRKELTS